MHFLVELWLPILLSAVFVFIWSSIVHMVIKWHASDCLQLDGEAEILTAIRAQNIQRGEYMFPYCADMKAMDSEEMQTKMNQGPIGFMTIMPNGQWPMGKSLLQWFLYTLLVGIFIACAAHYTLDYGSDYSVVFHFVAVVAALPYAISNIPGSIWKGMPWKSNLKFVVDGIIYALLTAGTFAWLWPAAG